MKRTAAFGRRAVLQLSFGGQHACLLALADGSYAPTPVNPAA
jgi:hypothetical protein